MQKEVGQEVLGSGGERLSVWSYHAASARRAAYSSWDESPESSRGTRESAAHDSLVRRSHALRDLAIARQELRRSFGTGAIPQVHSARQGHDARGILLD